jgi:hypothetical protein
LHRSGRAVHLILVGDEPTQPKADELLPAARNFTLTLAERVRGQGGAPAHLRRKREIEDRLDAMLKTLREVRARGANHRELERAAARLDLERLNDLIDRHNRYYPIEANLPIDPKSGGSLDGDRPFTKLPPVTPSLLVRRL